MSFLEIIVPALGLALIVNSTYGIIRSEKGAAKKEIIELSLGVLICVFSIWSASSNSKTTGKLQSTADSSKNKINELLSQRKVDSTNDAKFQQYLKDSLGIQVIDIATNTVRRTDNFYTIVNSLPKEGLSPSVNYEYKISKNKDSVIVFPKTGVWVKPFFSFDASIQAKNEAILLADGMSITDSRLPPEETIINGVSYKTFTVHLSIVRDKIYPLILDISADKNQYVIFGDESDPEKRYLYKGGKITWVPKKQ